MVAGMRAFRAVCRRPVVSSFNAARAVGAAWSSDGRTTSSFERTSCAADRILYLCFEHGSQSSEHSLALVGYCVLRSLN